jgi:hypothetical protein
LETSIFSEYFLDHPVFNWIQQNGQILAWTGAALLLLGAASFYFWGGKEREARRDYLAAEQNFLLLTDPSKTSKESQAKALAALESFLTKYPELQARYDGVIAQFLMAQGQCNKSAQYENRTLSRTIQAVPASFQSYARTSLLICNQEYEKALTAALQLDREISDKTSSLSGLNQWRIATLYQLLGKKKEELIAWQNLQQRADVAFQQLKDGQVSLMDYIETRIKSLEAQS